MISPRFTSKDTSSTAVRPENCLVRLETLIIKTSIIPCRLKHLNNRGIIYEKPLQSSRVTASPLFPADSYSTVRLPVQFIDIKALCGL